MVNQIKINIHRWIWLSKDIIRWADKISRNRRLSQPKKLHPQRKMQNNPCLMMPIMMILQSTYSQRIILRAFQNNHKSHKLIWRIRCLNLQNKLILNKSATSWQFLSNLSPTLMKTKMWKPQNSLIPFLKHWIKLRQYHLKIKKFEIIN